MKRLVITESEKQRILGMHQTAAKKLNLLEGTGNQTLDRILNENNQAAWRFIDGVTAAEKAGALGTVDEKAIANLVYGIKTVDLYITILHNIRENVQDNYCDVTSFAVKSMFRGEDTFGAIDVPYYVDPINRYLSGLCNSAEKSYGGDKGDPKKGGFEFECGETAVYTSLPAGCKGNFKTSATKMINSGLTNKVSKTIGDGGINP
jgi:hypothetical protein